MPEFYYGYENPYLDNNPTMEGSSWDYLTELWQNEFDIGSWLSSQYAFGGELGTGFFIYNSQANRQDRQEQNTMEGSYGKVPEEIGIGKPLPLWAYLLIGTVAYLILK